MFKDCVMVDTSAWYALFDQNDKNHKSAKKVYENNLYPFIITNCIIHEILTLVKKRLGNHKAIEIGKSLWEQELASFITVTLEDEEAAWKIFQRYDDKGFSFTDCITFAVMERLKISHAFVFDEHFTQYGKWKCLP